MQKLKMLFEMGLKFLRNCNLEYDIGVSHTGYVIKKIHQFDVTFYILLESNLPIIFYSIIEEVLTKEIDIQLI